MLENRVVMSETVKSSKLKWWQWGLIALGLLFLFIGVPYSINWLILTPQQFDVVRNDETSRAWLGFWDTYIGAIASLAMILVTLYVLKKQLMQNHEENVENRKLQLNVLKYQIEMQKLNDFRLISGDYLQNYNNYNLTIFGNEIFRNKKDINDEIKLLSEKMKFIKYNLDVFIKNDEINAIHDKYIKALENLVQLAIIKNNQKGGDYYNGLDIKAILLNNNLVSNELKQVCQSKEKKLELIDILDENMTLAVVDEQSFTTCISSIINDEQARIEKILDK